MNETPNNDNAETGDQQESNAAKLRARLDRLEDMYFRPGAYETKIAQWEVKELRAHRPHLWKDEPNDEHPTSNIQHPTSNGGGNAEIKVPSYVSSAAELAQVLDTYFRERIYIQITPTLVGLWRKGLRVGEVFIDGKKVIPPSLPKNKSGNRFETQPCIDWVEKWILPQKGVRSSEIGVGTTGAGTAMDFDRIKQEHAIWQMQREKDLSDGKFKSVEVFNQHLTSFGLAVNRALNESEKGLKKAIVEELLKIQVEHPTSNIQQPTSNELIDDAIARGVRAAVDGLRASVAKSVMDAEETGSLATDEHRF